ncbi:MAG: cytochrome c3 family protein [Gemmatimonadales bacterium]
MIRSWNAACVLLALTGVTLTSCVDEQIVYRDRNLFEEPLAQAANFLGYTDEASKLTVCGNCHVEKQGDWIGTAHADAWATLKANSHASASCEGCHSVNELGNHVTATAGYNGTGEARYHDVQCESCHGPGLTHVTNPLEVNAPLAPIDVGDLDVGCVECHTGTHHPFAEEWVLSAHGEGTTHQAYRTRDGCKTCHGGEGALAAWGVNTEYVEKGDNAPIAITCSVCHDPHANDNEGQLRFSVSTPEVEANLCMKCHQRRAVPDLGTLGTTTSGPHAPQGPLLLGELGTIGWTPPNFDYDVEAIRGTHGSERNTRLCATCHVNSYDVTDPDTGGHIFTVTGHRFLAIPCVDSNDLPTDDQSCGKTVNERNFASCTSSGCHGDETAALSALLTAQTRIEDRVADLNAMLALVPTTEFSTTDTRFTVAEGARFNAQLGEIESSAVHNPFLTEALLIASMDAVSDTYGIPAPVDARTANLAAIVARYGN